MKKAKWKHVLSCISTHGWRRSNAEYFLCSKTTRGSSQKQKRLSIFCGRTCLFSTTRVVRLGVVIVARTKLVRDFASPWTSKRSARKMKKCEIVLGCERAV